MAHSKMLPALIVLIVLESINTVINILPAMKPPPRADKKRRLVRGITINSILVACFVAYILLVR